MNTYEELNVDGYERVVYCENEEVRLKAYIAVHNTQRGPSLGGCRMWDYKSKADALTDVLRLSKGMTAKSALADLDLGGGKSVIIGDARTQKTPELLRAMGEFVEYMGGTYIVAEDVGLVIGDVDVMGEKTSYIPDPAGGDPGPVTAVGTYNGIKAACQFLYGSDDLSDRTIAIQGTGSVGYALTQLLIDDGAEVFVADVNDVNLQKAIALGATVVSTDDIYTLRCHVFSPCAMGGILNDDTIGELDCDIVAGSANNQLLEKRHGQELFDADILYAPDYVINAAGVIMIAGETDDGGYDKSIVDEKVNKIGATLTAIFEESEKTETPTNVIADKMADRILGTNIYNG